MAISYFNEEFVLGKKNLKNNYRAKKIRDKYLISTDQGSWMVLDKNEYKLFLNDKLDEKLFKILVEKRIIITPGNLNLIFDDQIKRNSFLFVGAGLHIITPTLRCNQKCVYCHSAAEQECKKEFDMEEKTADKVLEFVFQTPSKNITIEFQGGEPLLNFEIVKYLVKKAKEKNSKCKKEMRFALVTNLTKMNDEIIGWIKDENIDVTTSLDGPKELHDKNRFLEGGGATYDKVVEAMNNLKKNKIRVGALMVTTKQSLSYYKEIVDEYVKLGFNNLQIKYMNNLGFAKKTWKEIGYSVEEFIDFWKKSVDYMIELNKKGVLIKSRYVMLILKKILTKYDPGYLDFRSPCGIVCGQLAYNHKGEIFSCDEGRENDMFKVGEVNKEKYKDLIVKPKCQQLISASINDNYVCDNCVYKAWCGLCPVIAYAEQGNIIPKISSFSKCKIHKAQFDYVFEKLLFDEEIKKIFFNWLKN